MKRAIGLATGLVAIAVPGYAVHAAPGDDGFLFTSPDGEYTVVFPAEPAPLNEIMGGGFGFDTELYGTFTADGFVIAAHFDVPPGSDDTLDELSQSVLDDMGIDGGNVSDISLRGVPGVEFSGPLDTVLEGGSVLGHAYATTERLYLLVVMGFESEVSADDQTIATFFNSFDFVKEAF